MVKSKTLSESDPTYCWEPTFEEWRDYMVHWDRAPALRALFVELGHFRRPTLDVAVGEA